MGIPRAQLEAFSKEKTAIIGAIGGGLLGHLALNAGYKAFNKSSIGHRFESGQMASGFRQGVGGTKVHPNVRDAATLTVGPESLVNYDVGRSLGTQMAGYSKGQRYRQLKKLRKNVAMSDQIRQAPIGKHVVPAVNQVLAGKSGLMDRLPQVAASSQPTALQRAATVGVAGALGVASPEAGIHFGITSARRLLGGGKVGKAVRNRQLKKSLTDSPGAVSRLRSAATDMAVSPAFLDTYRLGQAVRADSLNIHTRRLVKSIAGQGIQLPGITKGIAAKLRMKPTYGPGVVRAAAPIAGQISRLV